MHSHPVRGRRRPTAAQQPSAVSCAEACPGGQNQSSCFPQEKRDKRRSCSLWQRRGASDVGPKSALLTSPPSPLTDRLISQTQYRAWFVNPYLPHLTFDPARKKLLKHIAEHSNANNKHMSVEEGNVSGLFHSYFSHFLYRRQSVNSTTAAYFDLQCCKGSPIWLSNQVSASQGDKALCRGVTPFLSCAVIGSAVWNDLNILLSSVPKIQNRLIMTLSVGPPPSTTHKTFSYTGDFFLGHLDN